MKVAHDADFAVHVEIRHEDAELPGAVDFDAVREHFRLSYRRLTSIEVEKWNWGAVCQKGGTRRLKPATWSHVECWNNKPKKKKKNAH